MRPALVVPAAGASRRLGRCKALVRIGPRSALEHLLAQGRAHLDGPALVVTGAHHEAIVEHLAGAAPGTVELLHNPDWELGRTGGLALAARALPGRDLCIAPVDCPLVPAEVFGALVATWEATGSPARGWLAPRCGPADGSGVHGHPLLLGRALAARLDLLDPGASLRELRGDAAPLLDLAVPHPEVLFDLDRPEDLEHLRAFERARRGSGR